MVASGFGINAKIVASFIPDPSTGQLTMQRRRPAAGAVRKVQPAPLRLRPRPRRHADPLRDLPGRLALRPLERQPGAAALEADHEPSRSGPNGAPCPGQIRPFNPSPRGRDVERGRPATSAPSTLKLDRDDGDQFLGDLNFKLPPGFTGNLRGIAYCPEAAIAAAAASLGRVRAGLAELSGLEPDRHLATSPPARARTRSTRSARCTSRARSRARRSASSRSPRRSPGPTTTASSSSASPCTSTRSTPRSSAVSDTVPSIIGGIPIRMRSIQVNIDKPQLHDQPDQLQPVLDRLAGDRRRGDGRRLQLLLPRGQLRDAAVQAVVRRCARWAGARAPRDPQQPAAADRPADPPGRREHQIDQR